MKPEGSRLDIANARILAFISLSIESAKRAKKQASPLRNVLARKHLICLDSLRQQNYLAEFLDISN
jgi:hypothetical protein